MSSSSFDAGRFTPWSTLLLARPAGRADAVPPPSAGIAGALGRQRQALSRCGDDRSGILDDRSDGWCPPVDESADDGPQTGAAADLACRAPPLPCRVRRCGDDLVHAVTERIVFSFRAIWLLPFKVRTG